jgi:hypothetical protein
MRFASFDRRGLSVAKSLAVALVVAAAAGSSALADTNPFASLAGSWRGKGTVTYSSGTKERLTCKVTYDSNASDSVQQHLTCASDSYKFEIQAYYRSHDGVVTGHWDELTLNISGSISGGMTNGKISGKLSGPGFTATVLVDTKGDDQNVVIAAQDQDIKDVSVDVRRQ